VKCACSRSRPSPARLASEARACSSCHASTRCPWQILLAKITKFEKVREKLREQKQTNIVIGLNALLGEQTKNLVDQHLVQSDGEFLDQGLQQFDLNNIGVLRLVLHKGQLQEGLRI
jgi:hypothetical protein